MIPQRNKCHKGGGERYRGQRLSVERLDKKPMIEWNHRNMKVSSEFMSKKCPSAPQSLHSWLLAAHFSLTGRRVFDKALFSETPHDSSLRSVVGLPLLRGIRPGIYGSMGSVARVLKIVSRAWQLHNDHESMICWLSKMCPPPCLYDTVMQLCSMQNSYVNNNSREKMWA